MKKLMEVYLQEVINEIEKEIRRAAIRRDPWVRIKNFYKNRKPVVDGILKELDAAEYQYTRDNDGFDPLVKDDLLINTTIE